LKNERGPIAPSEKNAKARAEQKEGKQRATSKKPRGRFQPILQMILANANKVIREDPVTENCAMAEMPFPCTFKANFQSPYANIAKRFIR